MSKIESVQRGLLLSVLGIMLVSCSPTESRVRDNGPTTGPLQDHAIFYQVQVPAQTGTPTQMKYCVQVGELVDPATGSYNCSFFEYISTPAGDKMSTEVYAGGRGAPALCQTGAQPSSLPFTCIYRYTDSSGREVRTSCSTKPQSFMAAGQPLMLFTLSNSGGTWMAQGLPQAAQTDAGHAAPSLMNAQVIPGACQNPSLAAIFPLPPSQDALQQPPPPAGGSTPQASTPGATVVTYQLNTTAAPRGTAIKTSVAQASELSEGISKCTLTSTGVVVKAELTSGQTTPDVEAKHYRFAKLISVQVGTVPMCESFVRKSVYLFSEHWVAQ